MEFLLKGVDFSRWEMVVLAAFAAWLLSWPALALARRLQLTAGTPSDNPFHIRSDRKKFKVAGIVVVMVALALMAVALGFKNPWRQVMVFISGLALIGLLDDLHPLTPGWKIILQTPLAIQISLSLPHPIWIEPGFLRVLFEVFWLVILTNAFNILDVADGLLPGLASVILLALGVVLWQQPGHEPLALAALAMAGAALGILPFNAMPAREILGDTGSLTLGGMAALCFLYVDWPSLSVAGGLSFAALMVAPLFEVTWVSVRRVRRGIAPWRASPHHFVYSLVEWGVPRMYAVSALVLLQAVPAAILLLDTGQPLYLLGLLSTVVIVFLRPTLVKE